MVSTPPLPLTGQIPTNLPLVVHHKVGKRLLVYGLAYIAWCLLLLGLAALLAPTTPSRAIIAVVVAGACLIAVDGGQHVVWNRDDEDQWFTCKSRSVGGNAGRRAASLCNSDAPPRR